MKEKLAILLSISAIIMTMTYITLKPWKSCERFFQNTSSFENVEMGIGDEIRCHIRMPKDYQISLCLDENNNKIPMVEGKKVSELNGIIPGGLAIQPYSKDRGLIFQIRESESFSISSEKEKNPRGIDIEKESNHPAYVYEYLGDTIMIYKINNDWVLEVRAEIFGIVGYKILPPKKEIKQKGQELYNLVTAIEVRY